MPNTNTNTNTNSISPTWRFDFMFSTLSTLVPRFGNWCGPGWPPEHVAAPEENGQDTFVENDATPCNIDILQRTHINQTNLWFRQLGDSLHIDWINGQSMHGATLLTVTH